MTLTIDFKKSAYELIALGGRALGYDIAADLLDNFLDSSGSQENPMTVDSAIFENDDYVKREQSSIKYKIMAKCRLEAASMDPGETKSIDIDEPSKLISHPSNKEVWYAFGRFYLRCTATITITKGTSSTYNVSCDADGTLNWSITDDYNWHNGLNTSIAGLVVKDEWAQDLVDAGEASEFEMKTEWTESFAYTFNSRNKAVVCGATCKDSDTYGTCDVKTYNPPCWMHK